MGSRRHSLVLCFVVSLLPAAGCGYDVIWTGVEFDSTGSTLRLATDEPLCGCVRFSNSATFPIHIRSTMHGRPLGELNLAPGQATSAHFDWAGPRGNQFFVLEVWNYEGQRVRAKDVLLLEDTGWPWQPCLGRLPWQPQPPVCPIGPLKLNTGRNEM